MTADALRSAFLQYFVERDHRLAASANLIPTHPAAPLFTNAGMVAFLPYFFREESPPAVRMTSAQKCVRVRGKHDDIENIGRTTRHLTFFEMLGNFSFGDYFKEGAIKYAWEFLTEHLHIPGDRLWVTVFRTDDEAAEIWRDIVGLPAARIQRLDEDDNFWEMGATGPCGPSSEIFYDKGVELGPDGGPAFGGEERFVEIWNLVFMQNNRLDDGSLQPLPAKNIDTGAGLERILPILQGVNSVFETDVLRRLIGVSEQLCGQPYGKDHERDVSLRIMADHGRAITFLLADGVVPSNEERGYVLRRLIRRTALHAQRAGASRGVLPELAAAVAEVMHSGYPDLTDSLETVQEALEREERKFRETLVIGLGILDTSLASGATEIPGEVAFRLHDTYGLPIELTREIAGERGLQVDEAGFEVAMGRQRAQARAAEVKEGQEQGVEHARDVLAAHGGVRFVGYDMPECEATLIGVYPGADGRFDVYADRTPFYAEGGGQIGDTGWVVGASGRGRVVDTKALLPGAIRHVVELEEGTLTAGDVIRLVVDEERRAALRRSHTGTHLLHWALRQVLGAGARQQGSLVAPDHLRFDVSHHSALTAVQLREVERLVAAQIRSNAPVNVTERSQQEAKAEGAIAFFGEKYGERVRVVRAGDHSVELCGGTHANALGDVGEFVIRSEGSVGANVRRIEAVVGALAHEAIETERELLRVSAQALKVKPQDVPAAIERLQDTNRALERQERALKAELDGQLAVELSRGAKDGVVVARADGRDQTALRDLAAILIGSSGVQAVGLIGTPDQNSVAIAVAVASGVPSAPSVARSAAKAVGGGGGGKDPRFAVAGGRDVAKIEAGLVSLRSALVATASI
jgi:alanyl-tRNA synthetase